jgi:hypothetical protein
MSKADSEEFQDHLFTYRHDGAEWSFVIKATSAQDASVRIGKLAYATYDGVVVEKGHVVFLPIVRLKCWVRNAWVRMMS